MVVLIACDNDETLIRLRDYLSRAGIEARATRSLVDAVRPSQRLDALVLFPDDFDTGEVTDGLLDLLGAGSGALLVLVTADSQSFEPLLASSGSTRWVLMPKPAWGWTILDVLRSSSGPRS
jgi:hypothetical protein